MAYRKGLDSEKYWEKRADDLALALAKEENKVIKELTKIYAESFRSIGKEYADFVMKYAADNKLNYTDLQKVLEPVDMAFYQAKMSELLAMYKDTQSIYILKEIEELRARGQITRLQALMDSINVELIKSTQNVQMTLEDSLIGIFTREYEKTVELFGIAPVINKNAVLSVINYPYAGKQFSDRIWDNKKALVKFIEERMVQGIVRGDSIQKISKELQKDLGKLYFQSERLVRTETNYAMNQGHLKGYEDAGLKYYKFLAHLDKRTSSICAELDGEVFKLSEAIVGVNYPPLHPNCRSTVIPIV